MWREALLRLRFLFAGRSRAEVDEELRFHIDRQIEAYMAAGMPEDEARRQAGIAFGGRERAREQCREQRPSWSLELLLRDLRFALRGLLRNPGLASVAVLMLAVAICANSTIFSLLSQALLRALPVDDPSRLVVLNFAGSHPGHHHSEGGSREGHTHEFSYPMYRDLRDKNPVLSGLVASAQTTAGVMWNNRSEAISTEMVSGNYFETLGVRPAVGRLFATSDETAPGANPVAVLNFDYWRTHLTEAPVVGRTLLINGSPFAIVGVAVPGFHSAVWGRMPQVYVPITMQRTVEPEWDYLNDRKSYWITVAGRLRSGVTRGQAEASLNTLFLALRASEFTALADQSAKTRQEFIDRAHLNVEAGARGFSPLRDDVRMPLTIVMGMVLLVVAMAIVNVASLLLVRAANRVREFSVRYALGATSRQIVRQLLCEGLLLGALGAGLGLALAPATLSLLIRWMAQDSSDPQAFTATLDWRVFAFTAAAVVTGSLVFSLAPAVQFWNPRLAEALKQQAGTAMGGSLRFRKTCVALQIGFSLLLIVGAGMFVRTIRNLRSVDPGFETEHLLSFELAPAMAGYPAAGIAPVEQRVLEALAALPGIRSVGATNDEDLRGNNRSGDVDVSGYKPRPDEEFDVELPWVSAGYLETLGVPLIAGRTFNASDTATSQKVSVVNASFVKHYFGSPQAALGQHVSRSGNANRPTLDTVIVGVVGDVKHTTVHDPANPTCYMLYLQMEKAIGVAYYARTWQSPQTAENSIRAAVANIDSKLIVSDVKTMTQSIDDSITAQRTVALLAAIFGAIAALLAGIGLYGILAYSTAQRTREIGIRMALGARRGTVVCLILRETLLLAGWAVAITIPVALVTARAVRSELFGVSFVDPGVYVIGIVAIGLVAALAGFVPARRAASVDPVRALRTD
ncbi:MAG: ABC transporter permease [Acidobacteriaceae bacterium]|nr:ABC transporter permease [Acidobacteriaceae bacterium]